jgi:hypothetical protein
MQSYILPVYAAQCLGIDTSDLGDLGLPLASNGYGYDSDGVIRSPRYRDLVDIAANRAGAWLSPEARDGYSAPPHCLTRSPSQRLLPFDIYTPENL